MAQAGQIFVDEGEIDLGGGQVAGPDLTEHALVEANPPGLKPLVHNDPYRSYVLAQSEIAGRPFVPVLWFCDGLIWRVTLSAVDPEAKGWEDATKAKALEMKAENDRLVTRLAGRPPPVRYDWGSLESFFDPRSGDVAISLTYR